MTPGRRPLLALLMALSLVATGCATLNTAGEPGDPDYAEDAEANMVRGNKAFESKNYLDAEKYFEHVKAKYPFLEASKEAELRLADSQFEREKYAEARDGYKVFVKLHPTHPRVDYAAFRAAYTHYKEIPSDFFLLPPAHEKDQSEVKASVRALTEFVRQYPQSERVPEAEKTIATARKQLAEHELYVAEFYARREKWAAVASRYEGLLAEYRGLGLDEKALFGLYEAYLKLNDSERAQKTLQRVLELLPGSPAADRARRLLGA